MEKFNMYYLLLLGVGTFGLSVIISFFFYKRTEREELELDSKELQLNALLSAGRIYKELADKCHKTTDKIAELTAYLSIKISPAEFEGLDKEIIKLRDEERELQIENQNLLIEAAPILEEIERIKEKERRDKEEKEALKRKKRRAAEDDRRRSESQSSSYSSSSYDSSSSSSSGGWSGGGGDSSGGGASGSW